MMKLFAALQKALGEHKTAALAGVVGTGGEGAPASGGRMVVAAGGVLCSGLEGETEAAVLSKTLSFLERGKSGLAVVEQAPGRSVEIYVQLFAPAPRLVILGGGHVGAALSKMAALLDYEIIVVDDRLAFAGRERHPDAHRLICDDFGRALESLAPSLSDYIVIVTRGHRHDRACLEQVLGRPCAYVGMIGSRRRVKALLEELAGQGFSKDDLAGVHTPIGLEIGAETEGEIALSILAEITGERRAGDGGQALQEEVLRELAALEQVGGRAVLVTIIKTAGSTPRKAGAWMLVHPDGWITGTIGGGCAEAEARREALQLLGRGAPRVYQVDMTGAVAAEEGMVCGGRMTLYLEPLDFPG